MEKKEAEVNYRVHRLEVKKDTAQDKLERFLNQLEGEVLAIVPYVTPTFQGMGATSKVGFLLIVEKAK
jgi:rhamnose utilization protein RhaD (predicted bifunctional aldolase and dehydrogenase)